MLAHEPVPLKNRGWVFLVLAVDRTSEALFLEACRFEAQDQERVSLQYTGSRTVDMYGLAYSR